VTSADAPLVTSLGLASNLGAGVVGAAAAQRAGLSRRYPLPEITVYEPGDEMETPVIGAPIAGVTDGFMQPGLWLRLAYNCLNDLIAYGSLPSLRDAAFWRRAGLLWVLPEMEYQRFLWAAADMPAFLERICTEPLIRVTELAVASAAVQLLPGGAASGVAAVERVTDLFGRTGLERVIVIGTDSWLDPLSIRSLATDNRLKSGEQPVGLCPGEAGVALLLERASAASNRGARGEARITAAATAPAPPPEQEMDAHTARLTSVEDTARRLALVVRQTLASARISEPFAGTIALDLNGEEWRARVWGSAQSRLVDAVDFDRCTPLIPAISFGDTGAASGLLGLCLSTRTYARGYAATRQTLLCAVSEGGAVGATLIEAP
jgi:3-oxoacyl-[acyl-carrier-protein] synthase-1